MDYNKAANTVAGSTDVTTTFTTTGPASAGQPAAPAPDTTTLLTNAACTNQGTLKAHRRVLSL